MDRKGKEDRPYPHRSHRGRNRALEEVYSFLAPEKAVFVDRVDQGPRVISTACIGLEIVVVCSTR